MSQNDLQNLLEDATQAGIYHLPWSAHRVVKAAAEAAGQKLQGAEITLLRQASEEGKLFGSVTVRDVAEALEAKGSHVPKSQLLITQAIKTTGAYTVKAQLHPEVIVPVVVHVTKVDQE